MKNFNEYLAGVIDGDGSLLLSKKGYGSLEITMDSRDERCLNFIKNKLKNGSLKARSGSKSVRFRIHNEKGIKDIINRINGLVQYPQRIAQLKKLCERYDIKYKEPFKLEKNSSYFSGILDSDGTIICSKKGKVWQMTVSVTSKNKQDLIIWKKYFKGNIYSDGKYFKWSIQSKKDILNLWDYIKKSPLHTLKQNRMIMILEFYRLYELHAFKEENTVLNKKFKKWVEKWSSYGYSRDANISIKAAEV